jgi:hypothetical protein
LHGYRSFRCASLLTVRTRTRRPHDKLGVRHQGQLTRRILQVTSVPRVPKD